MRTRILSPEEWGKVEGEGLSDLLLRCKPENIRVVAVEDGDGSVVAQVAVLNMAHFEGLWVRQDKRGNAGIWRALLRQAFAVPASMGEEWILGAAADGDEKMDGVCRKLGGAPIPMRLFALPVPEMQEDSSCRQQ